MAFCRTAAVHAAEALGWPPPLHHTAQTPCCKPFSDRVQEALWSKESLCSLPAGNVIDLELRAVQSQHSICRRSTPAWGYTQQIPLAVQPRCWPLEHSKACSLRRPVGLNEHLLFSPLLDRLCAFYSLYSGYSWNSAVNIGMLLLPWALVGAPCCWKGFKHCCSL